jgi:DUF2075 family protein
MSKYFETKNELESLIERLEESNTKLEKKISNLKRQKRDLDQLAKERKIGFPLLAEAYDEYWKLQDKQVIDFLLFKNRPAPQSSKIVSEFSKLRREYAKENKILHYINSYYEQICPFLIDLKEELPGLTDEDREFVKDYTEEEKSDEVTNYISKEEYRKLSTMERNQLALDRYWKRPKSKWYIGKVYERYVGYIYEEKGYDVEYVGILKGLEDLGRDLIAVRDDEVVVIQCKYWSRFKSIYENVIFQFFGTVFKYRDDNPDKKVQALFYTSTKLSDLARRFATELNIDLVESHKLPKIYPCIKCNISRINNEKIYHLPFDQQYDNVKIEKERKEFYCTTVMEAEEKGFRRALRYKGYQKTE